MGYSSRVPGGPFGASDAIARWRPTLRLPNSSRRRPPVVRQSGAEASRESDEVPVEPGMPGVLPCTLRYRDGCQGVFSWTTLRCSDLRNEGAPVDRDTVDGV